MALNIGETLRLQSGKKITVKTELGEGGQGYVYKVEDEYGDEYALKWYKFPDDWMYQNLNNLIERGAPSENFLWPIMLTEKKEGSFGYVMALRTGNFKDIIKGRQVVSFNSYSNEPLLKKINAALKICDGFNKLHREGFCFHDINDGGFFIDPAEGDALICDCDNITPEGQTSPIAGKMRYMAPEIVMGDSLPNKRTDYFSLSVILFILLYGNHPLEGAKELQFACIDDNNKKAEKDIYGYSAVYIADPKDNSNRPVKNLHTNVLNWLRFYPKTLNDAFVRAFSKEAITNPDKRIRESEWIKILDRTRELLVSCEYCELEVFPKKDGCFYCQQPINIPFGLKLEDRKIPLTSRKKMYESSIKLNGKIFKEVGRVMQNKKTNQIGIKNLSDSDWAVNDSNKINIVKNNEIYILKKNDRLTFFNDTKAIVF